MLLNPIVFAPRRPSPAALLRGRSCYTPNAVQPRSREVIPWSGRFDVFSNTYRP